jgi:signal transduction histidine kinase
MRWTKEALENILENAVKYTEKGGSIKITVASSELFVKIDIADTGAGIAEDEYTDIFKRFYRSPRTSDQDGIGVGLYLAREIIVTQGGYIKVSSKIGKGSVFSIYIPRVTTLRDESTTLQNK